VLLRIIIAVQNDLIHFELKFGSWPLPRRKLLLQLFVPLYAVILLFLLVRLEHGVFLGSPDFIEDAGYTGEEGDELGIRARAQGEILIGLAWLTRREMGCSVGSSRR